MKPIYILIALLLSLFSITSCKTSADVMKRRYTKGHYFSKSRAPRTPGSETKIAEAKKQKRNTENQILTTENKTKPETHSAPAAIVPELTTHQMAPINAPAHKPAAPVSASAAKTPPSTSSKSFKALVVAPKSEKVFSSQRSRNDNRQHSGNGKSSSSDVKLVLCVILCFFIPPLAMFLWNEKTDVWFIVDLILFLLLFSWFFWGPFGLAGLASVVIALLRVLDVI